MPVSRSSGRENLHRQATALLDAQTVQNIEMAESHIKPLEVLGSGVQGFAFVTQRWMEQQT